MPVSERASTISSRFLTAPTRSRWITAMAIGAIILGAAYLRIAHLSAPSVTHVEMYVPGIRMPYGISVPGERLSLVKVLTGTFSSDTHPPGYYVLMWAWTKCFGVSAFSIRLPSALFGIACIPVVFWLGVLTGQRTGGWIAAILMAANPQNVFWCEVGRMFTLVCFLGLLSTVLLILLSQSRRNLPLLSSLYLIVILLGLSSHIFFWALFGTQVLWTFFNAWSAKLPLPGVMKLQILAMILGSPLLAFAAYQSGTELATLSNRVLIYGREYLQFSFLFPLVGFSSGVYPHQAHVVLTDDPHLSIARWFFFLLSLSLLIVGVLSTRSSDQELLVDSEGPSARLWAAAAAIATIAILFFIFMAKKFSSPAPYPTLRMTQRMVLLPAVAFAGAMTLRKSWGKAVSWLKAKLTSRFVVGEQPLVLALAFVPFLTLAVVSFFKPTFNARGMIVLGPYLLLVLGSGIAQVSRHRTAAIVLTMILGIAHYEGLQGYSHMSTGRADYKEFAREFSAQRKDTDQVFIQPSWYATPIFYYVRSDWDRFVGRDYERACREHPHARVWALVFYNYEDDVPKEIKEALAAYQLEHMIEAPGVRAVLYSPKAL